MNNIKNLIKILECYPRILIQTHDLPDPDAIASAFGIQFLLSTLNLNAKICYRGTLDKHTTANMIEYFNIDISNISEMDDITDDDAVLLVDSQKGKNNKDNFIGDEVAVIDHHPMVLRPDCKYADIRPDVGACSSIVAQYYSLGEVKLTKELATALLYGIKSATYDLTHTASTLDVEMYNYLYKQADLELLDKLKSTTLTSEDLYNFSIALSKVNIKNRIAFADLCSNSNSSLLETMCSMLLKLKDVDAAVAYTLYDNGLRLQMLSQSSAIYSGKAMTNVLSTYGIGGGHESRAGGFIMKEHLKNLDIPISSFIEEKFTSAI